MAIDDGDADAPKEKQLSPGFSARAEPEPGARLGGLRCTRAEITPAGVLVRARAVGRRRVRTGTGRPSRRDVRGGGGRACWTCNPALLAV